MLSTTAFPDGGQIPVKFSQAAPGAAPGEGTSPALTWTNVPAGTRSFLLHMHDLDVARNRTTDDQVHWLVWNIPGTSTGLAGGCSRAVRVSPTAAIRRARPVRCIAGPARPRPGRFTTTCSSCTRWTPNWPIEPVGDAFETRPVVMKAMQGHVLGKAVYMGFFRRPQ